MQTSSHVLFLNFAPMETAPTPTERYHPLSMGLHWLLGLGLLGTLMLGIYMTDLPFSPQRLKLYNWHKWLGMSLLALSLVRLVWRLVKRPPALPESMLNKMPAWQRAAHSLTHLGLYLLFFVVPMLGWLYSSAAGFPVVMLGILPLPDLVNADPGLAETLKPLHGLAADALMLLIALHIAAAIKHQVVDRDGLLQRMLPARTR